MYEVPSTGKNATDAPRRPELRDSIAQSEFSVGGWCLVSSPLVAEVMALAGYDWVCIDTQHGTIAYDGMAEMIRGLSLFGIPAVVRVGWNDPAEIMRALDAGASGIIVPMISGRADALRAVEATRYPPRGSRSWGPVRAALGDPSFTPLAANERVMCIPMIETVNSARQSAEIAALDGVDALLIGPADLSLSATNSLDRGPLHAELIATTIAAGVGAGIPIGTSCETPEEARELRAQGFRFVGLSSDFALLSRAATASARAARETGR